MLVFSRMPGSGHAPYTGGALSSVRLFLPEPASALADVYPASVPGLFCLLLDLKRLHIASLVPPSEKAADWLAQDLRRLHVANLEPPAA